MGSTMKYFQGVTKPLGSARCWACILRRLWVRSQLVKIKAGQAILNFKGEGSGVGGEGEGEAKGGEGTC